MMLYKGAMQIINAIREELCLIYMSRASMEASMTVLFWQKLVAMRKSYLPLPFALVYLFDVSARWKRLYSNFQVF
jgi:hypothetical protein